MFCPKCGSEIAEGSAFCGKCGAPVGAEAAGAAPAGSAQGAASGGVGAGAPAPKKNGAKIGAIAAAAVVAVVLVAGLATNWFGLAGVQPKEAVEVPAASQGADGAQDANATDGQAADAGESAGDAQGGPQAATDVVVKSAVEAYTWDELSQISAEIGLAGDEAAAIEVAKRYNLCTPEGKLDGTQVKSVTLADGTQTTVQIVGFAHDDKTSGGKAGITFIFGDCVADAAMNTTDTNVGGWEASKMRAYLNGDWLVQLPEDLYSVIVPVEKLTNNVGYSQDLSSITSTSDTAWLFSAVELSGRSDSWYDAGSTENWQSCNDIQNAQGTEYKLFADMAVGDGGDNEILIRDVEAGDGTTRFWWNRSPMPLSSGSFGGVYCNSYPYSAGPGAGGEANSLNGVVPGFCI